MEKKKPGYEDAPIYDISDTAALRNDSHFGKLSHNRQTK